MITNDPIIIVQKALQYVKIDTKFVLEKRLIDLDWIKCFLSGTSNSLEGRKIIHVVAYKCDTRITLC